MSKLIGIVAFGHYWAMIWFSLLALYTLLETLRNRGVPPGFYEQPVAPSTAQAVLSRCGIEPSSELSNWRILDFGCGAGRYMQVFATRVPINDIIGVDVDWCLLSKAHEKGFNCVLLPLTSLSFPFKDDLFDVVFSSNVIEHIPRELYQKSLREIHRVLKLGGRFVVGTPNYPIKRLYDIGKAIKTEFTRYYLFDDPTHCNKMSIYRLEKDLKQLFKEVYLEPTYIFYQKKVPWLRRKKVRHLLRIFGDKVSGYCIK